MIFRAAEVFSDPTSVALPPLTSVHSFSHRLRLALLRVPRSLICWRLRLHLYKASPGLSSGRPESCHQCQPQILHDSLMPLKPGRCVRLHVTKFGYQLEMWPLSSMDHSFWVWAWKSVLQISPPWCCSHINHNWFFSPRWPAYIVLLKRGFPFHGFWIQIYHTNSPDESIWTDSNITLNFMSQAFITSLHPAVSSLDCFCRTAC